MVKCYTGANWSKEFGEYIQQYKIAKQVFLDSESISSKERSLIISIQNILDKEEIKNGGEFDQILAKNTIFKFDENINFSIRRIYYSFQDGKINIFHCVVIFLMNESSDLSDFLNEFIGEIEIEGINVKFPEVKREDKIRDKVVEIIKDLTHEDFTKKICKNELVSFFTTRTVKYSGEIEFAEIRTLKDATCGQFSICIPKTEGILLEFISPKELLLDNIAEAIRDISFYTGANSATDVLYAERIDKNYTKPVIKIILVV